LKKNIALRFSARGIYSPPDVKFSGDKFPVPKAYLPIVTLGQYEISYKKQQQLCGALAVCRFSAKNTYLHPFINPTIKNMSISSALTLRAESKCELCSSNNELTAYTVPPRNGDKPEDQIVVCPTCLAQINGSTPADTNHLRCLTESMWSQIPAVQVMSYRLLQQCASESWAQDAIGLMYLDDATLEWAQQGADAKLKHKDSNGHVLENGDTVTLIQDLNVKGSSLTAKRGTAVRNIRLDPNNAEYIEGKVDGQHIVILTKFVRKQ
jgi:protein PhnA